MIPDENGYQRDERRSVLRAGLTLGIDGGPSVLVIREPRVAGPLRCDEHELMVRRPPLCSASVDRAGTLQPGDTFMDPSSGLQVLCTEGGDGVLTFMSRPLERKLARTRSRAPASGGEDTLARCG